MTRRAGLAPARRSRTPVRAALKDASPLQRLVKDGLGAVKSSHHDHFDSAVRLAFADSLDADLGLQIGREQENRWDYILGHARTRRLIGVEPHSAESGEVTAVIKKRQAAQEQIQEHFRDGARISKWLWVASGKVHFLSMEKETLRLSQSGITFVGRKIMDKHLV